MVKDDKRFTPMMKQLFSMKAQYPGTLMLFRCGDFHETCGEGAMESARILSITLTHRSNDGNGDSIEMAGFPHHVPDTYLPKLIHAGRHVTICDQLEDPKRKHKEIKGKKCLLTMDKIVKRGITELVTPGIATNNNILNYRENNFFAAVHFDKGSRGVSFLDISTGEFLAGEGTFNYVEKLLGNFQPKEVLFDHAEKQDFEHYSGTHLCTLEMDDQVFTDQTTRQKLLKHSGTEDLEGFGVDHLNNGVVAAGVILQYLEIAQHTQISHITSLARIEGDKYVRVDRFTIRSSELTVPMNEDGSLLLNVIDNTITPMDGRMLRRWMIFPLKDKKPINERLDVADYLLREPDFRECINEQFYRIGGLERIISEVAVGCVSPRGVVQLENTLMAIQPIKTAYLYTKNDTLKRIGEQLNPCESLHDRIKKEIQPDPPQLVNKGDVVALSFNQELDDLRSIRDGGKQYLLEIQEKGVAQTGITSLKIGFNNVFGYYLGVRNTFKDKVPENWIRKQTLTQAERYITPEFREYEEKTPDVDKKILALETQLYMELIQDMQEFTPQIQINTNLIAHLGCPLSFIKVSQLQRYMCPVVDDSEVIDIKQGHHPVIETQLPIGEQYAPNDVLLDTEYQRITMITGPNMADKSALLRQTALIILLAQIGCFVPAERARIGMMDKIFTRVGASDNISLEESTFVVKMTETSNILSNVTSRSLMPFDELGRGTSTYGEINIVWAIVEYLHEHSRAQTRTLSATHYHESGEMEKNFPYIKNFSVSIKEVDGKIIFVRKLEKGGNEYPFDVHVIEIAGIPRSIAKRANIILEEPGRDNSQVGSVGKAAVKRLDQSREGVQLSFFQLDNPVLTRVCGGILGFGVDSLTPVEALSKLNDIRKVLKR